MPNSLRRTETVCFANCTVLLIDDVRESLNLLTLVVKGFGFGQVLRSRSAEDAMRTLSRETVDLIVVDCAMPEMDGYDFVRWLRRDKETGARHVPVVMLAGHASADRILRGRDCGANYVVRKPITPALLLERIVWVSRERRSFVECATYVGPDRRYRDAGVPAGLTGRRRDDPPSNALKARAESFDASVETPPFESRRAVS